MLLATGALTGALTGTPTNHKLANQKKVTQRAARTGTGMGALEEAPVGPPLLEPLALSIGWSDALTGTSRVHRVNCHSLRVAPGC